MEEQAGSEHAATTDDATTIRHLVMLIGVLVVIAFGIAGLVSVVI